MAAVGREAPGSGFCLRILAAEVLWGPVPGHRLVLQDWCGRGLGWVWPRRGLHVTVPCIWTHVPHSKAVCKDGHRGKMRHQQRSVLTEHWEKHRKEFQVVSGQDGFWNFSLPCPWRCARGAECVLSELPSVHYRSSLLLKLGDFSVSLKMCQ